MVPTYWVRDRVKQGQFYRYVYWRRGKDNNKADYFSKHRSAEHHRAMRRVFLHESALSLVQFTQKAHCEGVLS